MKNKKLLVSLAIVAVVVVIVVVMASVFSVRRVEISYHMFNGNLTNAPSGEGGVPADVIEKIAKGKSTVFLSKTNFLTQVNAELRKNYPQWHAFAVVKNFPNVLEVHLVKRTAIAKLSLSTTAEPIYLDSFGCRVDEVPQYECIDITSAFNATDPAAEQPQDGTFRFKSEESNVRLQYVLEAILATWQCYVEIDEMDNVLQLSDAFTFDQSKDDISMVINLRAGGKIRLFSPDTDLTTRLIKAYGVYYNSNVNLQGSDWEITVYKNGRISTPDPNKK